MKNIKYMPHIEAMISMLIFGTVGALRRFVAFPSGFLAMSRGFIGCLVILLFMLVTRKLPSFSAIKKNALPLVLSGAFIGINWIFLFESFNHTTVAAATLAYYMAPLFVLIFSPIVLGERAGRVKTLAVCVAVLGMVLVCEPWSEEGVGGFFGIALALIAAVFYAAVTVTNKKLKDISSLDRTLVQLFVAAVTVSPYFAFAEEVSAEFFEPTSIALTVVLGVLHTGVAYLLFFGSVGKLPAVTVSLFGYIDPVFAVLLSAFVLREGMSLAIAIGTVVVIGSMIAAEIYEIKKAERQDK